MTANSVTKPKRDKRGQHPNSRANLRPPWKPNEKPPGAGGETVSHSLKDILREFDPSKKHNARIIAEKMVERAKILTGKSDAAILGHLLDRTEGKVTPDNEQGNPNIQIVIVTGIPRPGRTVIEAKNGNRQ